MDCFCCVLKNVVFVLSWCSNNAMSLFSKIKGKNAEFKNPKSVGEVPFLCNTRAVVIFNVCEKFSPECFSECI